MKNLFRVLLVLPLLLAGCGDEDQNTTQNVLATIFGFEPARLSLGQRGEGLINGSNFSGATQVSLGNQIAIEQFNVLSANQIRVRFVVAGNASPGARTISVTTPAGTGVSSTALSVINNRAPIANFSVDPPAGSTKIDLTFDASASRDPDGKINQYRWTFPDNTTMNGKVVKKRFSQTGDFEVVLHVTDNDGGSNRASREVEVLENSPPVARFSVDPGFSGNTLAPFFFNGANSYDPDGKIATFLWDFGDGSRKGTGKSVSHKYSKEGNFDVTLVVTDKRGQEGSISRRLSVEKVTEIPCSGRGQQHGRDVFVTLVSFNRPFAVIRPNTPSSCSRIFYRCGDLKRGDGSRGFEDWYGTICGMWDLGDGTFRIQLVRGVKQPEVGKKDLYLHAQSCELGWCRD